MSMTIEMPVYGSFADACLFSNPGRCGPVIPLVGDEGYGGVDNAKFFFGPFQLSDIHVWVTCIDSE